MTALSDVIIDLTLSRGWQKVTPLPTPLLESAVTVIDNKLYVFGGFTLGLKATKQVYVYEPQTNSWQQKSEMPSPVTHVNTAFDGRYLWLAGGFKGNHPAPVTNQVWQYDIITDTWQETVPLPQPRGGGSLEVYNGILHYIGGFGPNRDSTHNNHWTFSLKDNNTWVEATPLPEKKGHHSSAIIDGKMYIMGGQYRHDTNPIDMASAHVYDFITNSWSPIASLPEPRSHFEPGTFIYQEQIIIVGGRENHERKMINKNIFKPKDDPIIDSLIYQLFLLVTRRKLYTECTPEVTTYNPKTDTWSELSPLPFYLMAPAANQIEGQIIVAGGGRNNNINAQCRTLLNETLLDVIRDNH